MFFNLQSMLDIKTTREGGGREKERDGGGREGEGGELTIFVLLAVFTPSYGKKQIEQLVLVKKNIDF